MIDQATQLRQLVLRAGRTRGGDEASPPRKLVISGGKAGLGSTTLAVNLAVALASSGARAVLIDADLYRADVAAHCGLPRSITIGDVLAGRKDIHEALERGPGGIQVVLGTPTAEARNLCSDKALTRILRQIHGLGRFADVVLIDTGNGPTEPTIRFWQAADDALLITTPDAVAVMDTYAAVKMLLSRSAIGRPLGLVVNQIDSAEAAADVHRRIDQSCQRFLGLSLPLAGWIPSAASTAADQTGTPIVLAAPESPFAIALDRLAERILAAPASSPLRERRVAV